MPPQSSQQLPMLQPQMPSLRGQNSAFSYQFHKKYQDMVRILTLLNIYIFFFYPFFWPYKSYSLG
jgi:hypothetical protein